MKNGIYAGGVGYRVETYTNLGPDRLCELGCGWDHIETKCGSKPTCGYCSGRHWTSDHKCTVVGCTVKQGSHCGQTLEKCPNSKGNLILFGNKCTKKTEAAKAAGQSRGIRQAGRASANAATDVASGTNRVVLGHRPKGTVKDGGGKRSGVGRCGERGGNRGDRRGYDDRDCDYGCN